MGDLLAAEEYRQKLIQAFPPIVFRGLISTHDECDDGIHLRRELAGKRWDELSAEVLFHGSIAIPLLEPDALVAFLPAWLLRSMETSDSGDPIILELTLYFLCPGNEYEGWKEDRVVELVSYFNSAQRAAIADFLRFVLSWDTRRGFAPYAEFGLKWWDPE